MAERHTTARELSEVARRRALDAIAREDDGLDGAAPAAATRPPLSQSPILVFMNRHWVVEWDSRERRPLLPGLLRRGLRPLWAALSTWITRAAMRGLVPYLLHEREFFAHVVRFANEVARESDAIRADVAAVSRGDSPEARRVRQDVRRLREQLEAEVERLNERLAELERGSRPH